jgi:hypothetical protein
MAASSHEPAAAGMWAAAAIVAAEAGVIAENGYQVVVLAPTGSQPPHLPQLSKLNYVVALMTDPSRREDPAQEIAREDTSRGNARLPRRTSN